MPPDGAAPPPSAGSILLLQGDAEASLLADAESAIDAIFPEGGIRLARAWMNRPDWLGRDAERPSAGLVERGLLPDDDIPALLREPHRLVILSLLPIMTLPALRHPDGGAFVAHRTLRARWSAEEAAEMDARCVVYPPLTAEDAAASIEPLLERLIAAGSAVALTTAFRHVPEPLAARRELPVPCLRDVVRSSNLQVARLSQRTGCFVLDIDRLLARDGGTRLQADCYGGGSRAAEIVLDEFAALMLDALPDSPLMVEPS